MPITATKEPATRIPKNCGGDAAEISAIGKLQSVSRGRISSSDDSGSMFMGSGLTIKLSGAR